MNELSTVFARLRGMLLIREKVDPALSALAGAIKAAVPGAVGAGVSLTDSDGRRTSAGFTDDVVAEADRLQYELDQGPCLQAWACLSTVRVDDVLRDRRWPAWSAAVAPLPIRSVLSSPLLFGAGALGAFKVYASGVEAFAASAQTVLERAALPAATLLGNQQGTDAPQRLSAGLTAALASRDVISAACGVLMERHGLTREAALEELVRSAGAGHFFLHDRALQVLGSTAGRGRERDVLCGR